MGGGIICGNTWLIQTATTELFNAGSVSLTHVNFNAGVKEESLRPGGISLGDEYIDFT